MKSGGRCAGWAGLHRAGAAARTGRSEGHTALVSSAPREGGKGERRRERREGNSGPETKGGEQSREHPGHSPLPQSGTHAGAAAEHGEAWLGEGPGAAGRRQLAL